MDETGRTEKISAWNQLRWHVAIAFCLFFVDAVVFHQRILAIVTIAVVAVVTLAMLLRLFRGSWNRDLCLIVSRKATVYLVSALAIMVAFLANENVANRNAEALIAAITEFKAHHGRYPESLQELTPKYIEAVPPVNYALTRGPFKYHRFGCVYSARLSFQESWPAGVIRWFCFEDNSWGSWEAFD